jgi:hypothetical protein
LFKIIHGDIGPDITAKINQYIIDALHAIEMRGKIIIVFNLCSELLAGQSQLGYKGISQFYPV